MKRRDLFRRLARLEKFTVFVELVTSEMIMDWRADGVPESTVLDRALPSMMTGRLPVSFRADSIYEMDGLRVPGHWAPQHPDIFVRLVGQLLEGQINVSIEHDDLANRRCFRCSPQLLDRIDPLALVFMAEATWDPDTWTAYWKFRRGGNDVALARYYVETGLVRARKFEEDLGEDVAETKRETVRAEIARILKANAEFPAHEIASYGDTEPMKARGRTDS